MTYLQELRADIKRDLHFEWEHESALHELFTALRGRPARPGEINGLFEALYRDRLRKARTITLRREQFIEVLRREPSNLSRRVPTLWFEFLSTPPDLQGWQGALLFSVTSNEKLFHRQVQGGMLFMILFGPPDKYQIGFLNLIQNRVNPTNISFEDPRALGSLGYSLTEALHLQQHGSRLLQVLLGSLP